MQVRAIVVPRHGPPEVLEELSLDVPDRPPAGMVRVRVAAVALNHLDLWVRGGLPNLKVALPHRLGSDVVGTLEAIGDGARVPQGIAVGDRVVVSPGISCGVCETCLSGRDNLCRHYHILGESTHGGYAEVLDIPGANLLLFPARLSWEEAAAVPLVSLTAWQMVVTKANVQRGEVVLVHAAGSGVSTAAIQIAKSRGARVIATTTREAKVARAKELGADEVIDTSKQDFVAEARRLTGKRGVDVVIDHLGGDVFAKSLLALTSGGRLVTCGATVSPTPVIDLRHVFFRHLTVHGTTMGSKGTMHAVLREVQAGTLRPVVDRVLPMTAEGARTAHHALESGEVFGKVVLLCG